MTLRNLILVSYFNSNRNKDQLEFHSPCSFHIFKNQLQSHKQTHTKSHMHDFHY